MGPEFSPAPLSPDVATVYVYRLADSHASKSAPDVYVGDDKLFALQNGGYGVLRLPPGEHRLVAKNLGCYPAVKLDLVARGGEQAFVRFSVPAPTRPAPVESSGHWSIDLLHLPTRVAEARKWTDEQCQLTPGFQAVDLRVGPAEISKTKLVDGGLVERLK